MGIARAVQNPTAVQRGLTANRLRRRDVTQVRCLWWWGKRSRGWWSEEHADMEERLRRHQALMMHRYSKAMRRRSLWERDDSPATWRVSPCNWNRDLSSTHPSKAKVEDRDVHSTERQTEPKAWQEVHNDFESFKRAVDRAIERDPVGTLFGRRLRSPETTNNASWTSWSWIFDPKEIKEEPTPEQTKTTKPPVEEEQPKVKPETSAVPSSQTQASVTHSSSSSKTTTTIKSSQSIAVQSASSTSAQTVYDPISGRNVPITNAEAAPEPAPKDGPVPIKQAISDLEAKVAHVRARQNAMLSKIRAAQPVKKEAPKDFMQIMFGENGGFDIPVKTYKPHKVYGYTGETKPVTKPTSSTETKTKTSPENSIRRAYNDLRFRTLGNNIDANNFNCEPWNNKDPEPEPEPVKAKPVEIEEPTQKRPRTSPAPDENAPLFSGTAYASKAPEVTSPGSDWLAKEGFGAKQGMTMPDAKGHTVTACETQQVSKMQSALDRANAGATDVFVKKFQPELQPAVDRMKTTTQSDKEPLRKAVPDKCEDLDLLRASDIRAASKAARVTRQDIEDKKKQERQGLEKDYEARKQAEQSPVGIGDKMTAATSKTLLDHIKKHPSGIVARTWNNLNAAKQESKPATEPPKFSEPTVKPGVERSIDLERHTQVFEPKVAEIVDKAKSVKRELHDVKLSVGDVVNQRAVTDIAASLAKPDKAYESPYVLLQYNTDLETVTVSPLKETTQATQVLPEAKSVMAVIGSLSHPGEFVQHFASLDKAGYEVIRGGGNTLMFKQKEPATPKPESRSIQARISQLRNQIAAAEIAAQLSTIRTANVLDEIPTSIPTPGPAAPTAPPAARIKNVQTETAGPSAAPPNSASASASSSDSPPPSSTSAPPTDIPPPPPRKIRSRTLSRQEQVFSGQQRLKPQTTALPDPEHFQKQTPSSSTSTSSSSQNYQGQTQSEPKLGYFARLRRFVKRVVLTGLAFGVGAYGIGVIAEGIQGRAQIEGRGMEGPMKKLVLEDGRRGSGERQRSGIYSTESSR